MKIYPKPVIIFLAVSFFFSSISKAQEEFVPFEDDITQTVPSTNDEFESFDEFDETELENVEKICSVDKAYCEKNKNKNLNWVFVILAFTILSGFLVRFKASRNLRGLFLIAAVLFLGFFRGACPCPISSLQNLVLAGAGVDIVWQSTIWFLALIPITYLFGRVYCGWICHLGALQEFIHLPAKIKVLQHESAQKIMRAIRIILLITLIVQLFITKTNVFIHYDPFKVAFNLIATNTLSWVLLGFLLISSVFIYRPFCKAACPVGLILGWASKIPGTSVIGNHGNCTGCKKCDNHCRIKAITRYKKYSRLDNQECIGCGECISNCNKGALGFFRNNKKEYHDQITLKA